MKFKLCITIVLLIIAVSCLAITILIIPMLTLPALWDTRGDYDPVPASCRLHEIQFVNDWKKCRVWQSCREGCSSFQEQCYRVFIDYTKEAPSNNKEESSNSSHFPMHTYKNKTWAEIFVPIRINPDSCGDLPDVDCEYFINHVKKQKEFPCYYSRGDSKLVVMNYIWKDNEYPLSLAVGLPASLFFLFAATSFILCFWYCRDSAHKETEKIETIRKYAFE